MTAAPGRGSGGARRRPGLAVVGELRLRLGLRRLRARGGTAEGLAQLVLLLLSLPVGAVIAVVVGWGSYRAVVSARPVEAAVTLSLIFFAVWQTWTAVGLTMGERDGLDLRRLLVYPVPPARLYLLGLAASLLADPFALFWLAVLAGMLAGAALASPGPWLLVLALLLAAFACATVALVGLAQELLARVARRRHWRELAVLAALLAWLGIVFSASLGAPSLQAARPALRAARWLLYPAALATESAVRLYRGDVSGALPWLAVLALAAVASAWAAYRLALGTARAADDTSRAPPRQEASRRGPWLPEWFGPLLEKELLGLARHPAARIQLVLLPSLAVLLGWKVPLHGRVHASDPLVALPLLGIAAYVHVAVQGFWANALGWERGGVRTLFLAPVRPERILGAKNIALALYAGLLFAAMAAAYVVVAGPPPAWAAAAAIALVAGLAPVLYGIGNVISVVRPRAAAFGVQRAGNVPPLSGLLAMGVTSGALAMFAVPVLLALALDAPWLVAAAWVVMAVAAAVAWKLTLPAVGRLLARRREAVLAAVSGDDA